MSSAAAAAPGLSGPAHPVASWDEWQQRVDRTMEALVGFLSLFLSRQVSCPLKTVETSLSQMTGRPFDRVTLDAVRCIHLSMLQVVQSQQDPQGATVSLVIYKQDDEQERGKKGEPSNKKARRGGGSGRGFRAPPQMKNLADAIAKLKEDFKVKLVAFRSAEEGKQVRPPPLNEVEQQEEEKRRREDGHGEAAKEDDSKVPGRRSWDSTLPVDAANFLEFVQTLPWFREQIVHQETSPARPPKTRSVSSVTCLDSSLREALVTKRGLRELYSHQVLALEALLSQGPQRRHVMVTTGTASGKSMCYTLPLLHSLAKNPSTRALFLFPTKALAHDQLQSLRSLASSLHPSLVANCLDGDTPKPSRAGLRDASHVLLTNPDLVHVTLLPSAAKDAKWAEWLADLRYIVIDEAHHYRGALGAHVAMIVRRLLRMCKHCARRKHAGEKAGTEAGGDAALGAMSSSDTEDEIVFERNGKGEGRAASQTATAPGTAQGEGEWGLPSVILCSATIANAREHGVNLTGLDPESLVVVDEDGSPQGLRTVALWNPPLIRPEDDTEEGPSKLEKKRKAAGAQPAKEGDGLMRRRSPYKDTARLLAQLVLRKVSTLVFVKVRYISELVVQLTRELLPPEHRDKVAAYRAGYLAEKRREVESGLASGRLVGVVSTNALELGVDVGAVGVTLHVGLPPTMASLMQQAGRAGRSGTPSLSVVIAHDSPLDQLFVGQPNLLLHRPLEAAVADPTNPVVLADHLRCAAYELPLPQDQVAQVFGDAATQVLGELVEADKVVLVEPVTSKKEAAKATEEGEAGTMVVLRGGGGRSSAGPARGVGIRSVVSGGNYSLINGKTQQLMETLEPQTAFYQVYEGAVYLHQGESYVIKKVDLEKREALLHREDVSYFTATRDHTRVTILGQHTQANVQLGELTLPVVTGPVRVVKQVYGYKVKDKKTHRVTDTVELFLPPLQFDTTAVWLPHLPPDLRHQFRDYGPGGKHIYTRFGQAGLHAIEHLLISLAPLHVMCDPADLSCQHTRRETDLHQDKLLLFETHQGGLGLARRLADCLPKLLRAAYAVLQACTCDTGCQSCIMLSSCYEEGPEKAAALQILQYVFQSSEQ